MPGWKLLSYRAGSEVRAGILVDGNVVDAGESVLGLLRAWDASQGQLERLADDARAGKAQGRPLADVKLEAPIRFPGAVFAASANYKDPEGRMRGKEPPDKTANRPSFFMKPHWEGAVIGPGDDIRPPRPGAPIGFEIELGVVIGRAARPASAGEAMACIAGYTIVNDLGDMTPGRNNDIYQQWFGTNWFRTKCFDTCFPMGPWITPSSDIPDPHDLRMQLWVKDELQQDVSTSQMLFSIPELIVTIADQLTLHPGDVISTGTYVKVGPEGPIGRRLQPGDVMRTSISGIGEMVNPVADAT
ncbi:MAG TPA: fumarylacetoacetate hydrolase family protein [Chloroflexota bacterium]|nr:fumarylacetoacetate hydrolase family protein [Chloroflexota bacterium]